MTERMRIGKEIARKAAGIMGAAGDKVVCVEKTGDNGTAGLAIENAVHGMGMASAVISIDRYIDRVMGGELTEEDAAEEVARTLDAIGNPVFKVRRLTRETILDECRIKLVNAKANLKATEGRPYRLVCDLMELVVLPIIENDMNGVMQVDGKVMAAYGIGEEELFEAAHRNTARGVVFKNTKDFLGASDGTDALYMLSNKECMYGAALAVCPEVLMQCRDMMGSEFFIIPSSIHELLLCRKSEGDDAGELAGLVKSVNCLMVAEEEILSDRVYGVTDDGRLYIEA